MLRSSRGTLNKILGTHAADAWTSLDAALQLYHAKHSSSSYSSTSSSSTTPLSTRKKLTTSMDKLLCSLGTSVPDQIRRRMREGMIQTLDDVVYYLANQNTLQVFNDERKCGETPTTPRSIPPAEHLHNTLTAFRILVCSCWREWMDDYATSKLRRKVSSSSMAKHMQQCVSYAGYISDKGFVRWLCQDETLETERFRRDIAGHFRCTLLQLGEGDPGSHAIRGGFCCKIKGCRRSAARSGICVGHALHELSRMEKLPNPHTFMTDATHRTCLMRWFVAENDKLSIKQLQYCYKIDSVKQCCSISIRKRRCSAIFAKYSRRDSSSGSSNSGSSGSSSSGSTLFETLCNVRSVDLRRASSSWQEKEKLLLHAYENTRACVERKLCKEFFRSQAFLDHVDGLRDHLSSPRGGRSDRFEWSLPSDTSKAASIRPQEKVHATTNTKRSSSRGGDVCGGRGGRGGDSSVGASSPLSRESSIDVWCGLETDFFENDTSDSSLSTDSSVSSRDSDSRDSVDSSGSAQSSTLSMMMSSLDLSMLGGASDKRLKK